MAEKRVSILKRANKLFRQGKAEAAVKEYTKILTLKPDDLEVRRIVGDLQLRESNIPKAIEQFEWIADHYLKEGFFAKAIAMFKRITRVDPEYEGALFKLAELYTKQGLVMEAKQIYLDIAEECKRKNNQKKALDMYKKILEFDRGNIKMRLLLADNYLKEGLEGNAVDEYLIASDILINKKDFRRVEELLSGTLRKIKNTKIIGKLIRIYTTQGQDDKAIEVLQSLGQELHQDIELLKVLGELYLKKEMMDEAESIFSKIAEIDPEETEVIMRLGKVYLQRDEYDKTFQLFVPVIDKNIAAKKFEEASSLLRFIIASNNTFIPALTKLASIFKLSGKTNNLIALYESLIPVYEQKGMKDQLKKVLEELIQLSDAPFSYEEQLASLTGEQVAEMEVAEQERENEREKEFISFNLRKIDEALQVSDTDKAIGLLKKAKSSFPKNVELRQKLFEVYLENEQSEPAVEEGKALLELYKFLGQNAEHADMVEKLSRLRPEDDSLMALSGDEKTSIEIDFDQEEFAEQIREFESSSAPAEAESGDDDVLLLSDADNVTSSPLQMQVEEEIAARNETSKSLSSVLSEVDFYVNDGYFGDAEKLIEQLKTRYPGNQALLSKIQQLEQAKSGASANEAPGPADSSFEIERPGEDAGMDLDVQIPAQTRVEHTERIEPPVMEEFVIEHSSVGVPADSPDNNVADDVMVHQSESSNVEIDLDSFGMSGDAGEPEPMKLSDDDFMATDPLMVETGSHSQPPPDLQPGPLPDFGPESLTGSPPEPETQEPQDQTGSNIFEVESFTDHSDRVHSKTDSQLEIDLGFVDTGFGSEPPPPLNLAEDEFDIPGADPSAAEIDLTQPEPVPGFEIESSIAAESSSVQEHEDSKMDIRISDDQLMKAPDITMKEDSVSIPAEEFGPGELEIEMDSEADDDDEADFIPEMEIDKDLLIQSPSIDAGRKVPDPHSQSSSGIDEFDLDSIMEKEDSVYDLDSPFKDDMSGADLAFENDEDLLEGESLFIEEDAYLEIEKNVPGELEAISFWLKELEKQRTSTIEKNMMEIFEEFKKGVDEKIGQEDYDTRYNLGIAYKEMGLLEEAIHEFLISAKHPLKFFDSAGLLGMCFRDKGMYSEAAGWFEKALETPDRKEEEYIAIRYEMVITLKLNEEYPRAVEIIREIVKVNPGFRDIAGLYNEIKTLAAQ
ncbi:MAG: tetratricopeptide repeat protein [bacterium]|nr:tetratricopeptide repeat protein [bacterium]